VGYEPPIRWDIVEEHLDEAAFLYQLWEQSLRSPKYTLREIAEGPEERMLAHLDGLVVGGSRVAQKLLIPSLASDEPGLVFAAAYALLASEDGDFLAPVLEALTRVEPEPKASLLRAMELVPGARLEIRWVELAAERGPLQADLALVLVARGVDPGQSLDSLAGSSDTALRTRVLQLGPRVPGCLTLARVEEALSSPDELVRSAALTAAALLRARNSAPVIRETVKELGTGFASAAVLLALSGDESAVAALVPALRVPTRAADAALALGFTGRTTAVDVLVSLLDDAKLAALAAESISAITGVPIAKELSRPPSPWDPDQEDDGDVPSAPEVDLPQPEPAALRSWWKTHAPSLDRRGRLVGGLPHGAEQVLRALESGPANRRHWLAVDLAMRLSRAHVLTADALSARQRAELSSAGRLPAPTRVGGTSGPVPFERPGYSQSGPSTR